MKKVGDRHVKKKIGDQIPFLWGVRSLIRMDEVIKKKKVNAVWVVANKATPYHALLIVTIYKIYT